MKFILERHLPRGNMSTAALIDLLGKEWPAIEAELNTGAPVIEIR